MHSKYIIVGSSHAALEAATAIRLIDAEGALTLLTRDAHLPYSPTILPYLVSGRARPDKVVLRGQNYFRDNAIAYVPGAAAVSLDPALESLRLESGETWRYDRLLIATGAAPALPPVRGLDDVPFHVLRSMDDAVDGLLCSAGGARAREAAGEHTVRDVLRRALAQLQDPQTGAVTMENTFRCVAACR